MMTYNLKGNRRCDFVRGRGSDAGMGVPTWCGGAFAENDACKYLIFLWLPPFFTIFHHISYHFSAINDWFLAGYKEIGVYLNRGAFANAKAINRHLEHARLLPEFQPISAYFGLFKAKKGTRGIRTWGRFAGCNRAALGLDSSQ
jgi:hypothetical protein